MYNINSCSINVFLVQSDAALQMALMITNRIWSNNLDIIEYYEICGNMGSCSEAFCYYVDFTIFWHIQHACQTSVSYMFKTTEIYFSYSKKRFPSLPYE